MKRVAQEPKGEDTMQPIDPVAQCAPSVPANPDTETATRLAAAAARAARQNRRKELLLAREAATASNARAGKTCLDHPRDTGVGGVDLKRKAVRGGSKADRLFFSTYLYATRSGMLATP
jgi:hypothetical protein